jgi:hypothetical protein
MRTDEPIIRYVDKVLKRLREKYMRLLSKGKLKQMAIMAVVRELSGFMWGVMNISA